jgi:hypothetical protein
MSTTVPVRGASPSEGKTSVPPARTLPPEAARRLTASLSVLGRKYKRFLCDEAQVAARQFFYTRGGLYRAREL